MSRVIFLALAALWAGSAQAAEDEISVQLGAVDASGSPSIDRFAPDGVLPLYGIRGGVAVHDRVALIAGLATGQRGQRLIDDTGQELFRTAYNATTVTLGAKVDYDLGDHFAPYGMAGVIGHHGLVRLDDDPTRRDHPGQVVSGALGLGGTAAIGFQARFLEPDQKLRPAFHAEVGWQGVLRHRHPESDDRMLPMGYSGVVFRAGLGTVF